MRKEIFDQFTLVGISSDGKCIEFLKGKEFLNYSPEYEIMMVLDEENSVNKKVIPIKNSDDIKIPEWVDKAIASYLDKGWGSKGIYQMEFSGGFQNLNQLESYS